MLLNFIFLAHAALAIALALLLLSYPDWLTPIATSAPWLPGPMAEIAAAYARLTAVGLILLALVTSFARQSASPRVRWVAVISMLAISGVKLGVALLIPFQPMKWALIGVALGFGIAYLWIMLFRRSEV